MDVLHGLRVFARVVDSGSFSAVAREMGVTQPTVSKIVSPEVRETPPGGSCLSTVPGASDDTLSRTTTWKPKLCRNCLADSTLRPLTFGASVVGSGSGVGDGWTVADGEDEATASVLMVDSSCSIASAAIPITSTIAPRSATNGCRPIAPTNPDLALRSDTV